MQIERWFFRISDETVKAGYSNSDLWKYVMVKAVREDPFSPEVRHTFSERFTFDEKNRLEELSDKVNLERRTRGIL
jgi:hypothetical protein